MSKVYDNSTLFHASFVVDEGVVKKNVFGRKIDDPKETLQNLNLEDHVVIVVHKNSLVKLTVEMKNDRNLRRS